MPGAERWPPGAKGRPASGQGEPLGAQPPQTSGGTGRLVTVPATASTGQSRRPGAPVRGALDRFHHTGTWRQEEEGLPAEL